MRTKVWVAVAVSLALAATTRAQFSANFQTNTISAVTSNWVGNGTYVLGSNTFADVLQISNGGVLSNGTGYIGYETGGSNNAAIVSGTGSVWSNGTSYVGFGGAGNTLIISNGGAVVNGVGTFGFNVGSSNNSVSVSGPGSFWKSFGIFVGGSGAGNSLIISNGGAVLSYNSGTLGENSSSSGNTVTVTGTGSVWTNEGGPLTVGGSGSGNTLTITNGGAVFVNGARLGLNSSSSNNAVLVSGTGSSWIRDGGGGALTVGQSGSGNRLTIADGGYVNVNYPVLPTILGSNSVSSGNSVTVTGPGSTWSTPFGLIIGDFGAGNSVTITNGGKLNESVGPSTILGLNSSSTGNTVTVTGTGSVWTNQGTLTVGSSGSGNTLTIANGGAVFSSFIGILGSNSLSSGNAVIVTGTGSVWRNQSDLYVGYFGSGNSLMVINGGAVFNTNGYLGYSGFGRSNNSVTVSGTGSVWRNTGNLVLRTDMSNMVISNGGAVFNGIGSIIAQSNRVTVTGPGSIWSNQFDLYVSPIVGFFGNSLTIANGGAVFNGGLGVVGSGNSSGNNMVLVDGPGSVWSNLSTLIVGDSDSFSNLLLVAGGSVLASNLVIGGGTIGSNNVVRLDSGSIIVKNALGNGSMVVGGQLSQGALLVNGGSLTVDSLVATNNTSGSLIHTNVVNFNGGVINSGGAAVTNAMTFLVGDGVDAANYHLQGGVHSFASGLEVRNNGSLTGCGTINGNVVVDVGGIVLADCGGTLTFTGILTNNGILRAVNGSVLEAYGPVVNNGIIDIQTGTTNIHSTFINNGTVADASYFRVTSITRQSNDIQLGWTTIGGRSYVVQTNTPTGNGSYTNAFTDVGAALLAPGLNVGTTNYIDVGGATNQPARFYRVRLVP